MMMRIMMSVATFSLVALTISCSNPMGDDNQFPEAMLTHEYGFDFSAGRADTANYQNNDGEIIFWQPGGADHAQYARFDYLWWRSYDAPNEPNKSQDMGAVGIGTVKSAPAQWDASPTIPALIVGHTIVVKCRDGYAKFEVTATDTANFAATVKWFYSTDATFAQ
jgi:hypothetical protein